MARANVLTRAARNIQALNKHKDREDTVMASAKRIGLTCEDPYHEWWHFLDASGMNPVSYRRDSADVYVWGDRTLPRHHIRTASARVSIDEDSGCRCDIWPILPEGVALLIDLDTELSGVITANVAQSVDENPQAASLLSHLIDARPQNATSALYALWQQTAEELDALRREVRESLQSAITERDYARSFGWADREQDAWQDVNRALSAVA